MATLATFGRVTGATTAQSAEAAYLGASGRGVNLRELFRSIVACGQRTLYVSDRGNDSSPGTRVAPYRQIQRAVSTAEPGDLILVGPGTYDAVYVHRFAGQPTAWLGIMSLSDTVLPLCFGAEGDVVGVNGSSYVGIYGFEVSGGQSASNPNGSGVSIYGNSHHVVVWNNTVHTFPGGGINCFDVNDRWGFGSHDMLDISFNTIHDTSRYSPSGTSGISIYASRDLTDGATWDGRYANRVVGNYIYNIRNLVPDTAAGYSYITDGNAVSIDSLLTMHHYTKPVLIDGNLLVGCGGRAVHVNKSVNVDGVGNTGIGNLRTVSPAITGGCEFDGTTDGSVRYHGNVIFPRHSPNWRDSTSTFTANVVLGGSQAVTGTNINRQTIGYRYMNGNLGDAQLLHGQNVELFAPLRPDRVPREPGALGYQTLGVGTRPAALWAAGSLEATRT
jgi:hypothetical protein